MDPSADIMSLIAELKLSSPRLYTAIEKLTGIVFDLNTQLNPLIIQSQEAEVAAAALSPPAVFAFELPGDTLRFTWSEVDTAAQYEVRVGADWDTASFVFRTSNLLADVDPIVSGTYTYLIKSIAFGGTYSTVATALTVVIPGVATPTLSASTIDNNVILTWTEPEAAYDIDFYELFKDGISFGFTSGNFATRFELSAGTYEYSIIATDIAGNESAVGTVIVDVRSPPDFELTDERVSDLSGTLVNTMLEGTTPERLLASVDLTETWDDHFIANAWTTIQDQIDAGFPYYAQPALTGGAPDGSYEEKIDYGTIVSAIIVTVTYNYDFIHVGHDTTVVIKMAASNDDITYTAFTSGAVQFFASVRYLKLRLEFTGADNKSLIEVYNLTVRLDVKREQDGGVIQALAADVAGTITLFNKNFKDIDSINVSPMSTVASYAIVDFVDIPDPTGFLVLAFDSAGVRVDSYVRWIARGITGG